MIRSTKHHFSKYLNKEKYSLLMEVIEEYRSMVQKYINIIWNDYKKRGWNMLSSDICNRILSRSSNNSRLRQAAAKQACSIVNGVFSKQNKRIYIMNKLRKEGKEFKYLQSVIDKFQPQRPSADQINPILDYRFFDIKESKNSHFDLFLRLSSLGNKRTVIIPIKYHKQSRKWLSKGILKRSIAINEKYITFFYEVPDIPKKKEGIVVGADQGMSTCLTLSDTQTTKKDRDGYDLKKICESLARKKAGSKSFEKTSSHRKNHINWALNQLDFSNIKEVRLEKIKNIRKGRSNKGKLAHWTYPDIRTKLSSLSEIKGFNLVEQDNKFRSQRCSKCGWVHKLNRDRETFKCRIAICGFNTNADLNAALNHSVVLYDIPYNHRVWKEHMNRTSGFYWKENDLCELDGKPIVSHNPEKG